MSKFLINNCIKNSFCLILNKSRIKSNSLQTLKFCSNLNQNNMNETNETISESSVRKALNEQQYEQLCPHNWRPMSRIERVLLVMPRQKWGNQRIDVNAANRLMSETIALINTLPNMKVIDSLMISTLDINKKRIFGSGNFHLLKQKINSNPEITSVVFSIDMLSSVQMSELESQLKLDIYDRYSIVLNIFRSQAKTSEAKLQIALAEIPYIRNNLRALQRSGDSRQKNLFKEIGGFGETWIETRKQLLIDREIKIKKLLAKIQSNRELLRLNRERKQFPVVAVVGYTNSGKTSLIKALTHDQRLVPKNQLFATLDVTVHEGRLPSGLRVLYTDTIGFISEIPIDLIHSFKTTLSEICLADVIIHVLDVSHPNHQLQEQTVNKTLDDIEVNDKLKNTIIEVANKVDLVRDDSVLQNCNKMLVSATQRLGLDQLIQQIETSIIANTGRLEKVLRVANGGHQYQWLYRESAIRESIVDPKDANFLIIKIYITFEAFEKFKHSFHNSYCEVE